MSRTARSSTGSGRRSGRRARSWMPTLVRRDGDALAFASLRGGHVADARQLPPSRAPGEGDECLGALAPAFDAYRMDFAGSIEGLDAPPPRAAVSVRPTRRRPPRAWPATAQLGRRRGEVLWPPTPNTVVEGTVHTDFAQAEVDRPGPSISGDSQCSFPSNGNSSSTHGDVVRCRHSDDLGDPAVLQPPRGAGRVRNAALTHRRRYAPSARPPAGRPA